MPPEQPLELQSEGVDPTTVGSLAHVHQAPSDRFRFSSFHSLRSRSQGNPTAAVERTPHYLKEYIASSLLIHTLSGVVWLISTATCIEHLLSVRDGRARRWPGYL